MSSQLSNVIEFPRRREHDAFEQAVVEERQRIARDLHDVVSYGFATVSVNAAAALQTLTERPEQAAEALEAIRTASNEALAELRVVLGVLRSDVASASAAPGLGRLATLAANTTAAGVATNTRVDGQPHPLPADVDAVAYRIVQEALTNVLRHAGAASALVTITYGREYLGVEVEDDGDGSGTFRSGGGRGIAGMRERAESVGGELDASTCPGSGFRVCARLPVVARP
jgi:signal transduction histidine kinase